MGERLPHIGSVSSRIAVKTGIDVKAQSMAIRGKQRLPLASQSIAKAFWVTLVHTQTQGYTHRQQEDTPQGHINPPTHTLKN